MSTTDPRADFGAWWLQTHTFDGPATIEDVARRAFDAGHQAATEAAKATGTAGEIDADAEMAKVKRDVELMGVGFLVDRRRCSLDRITWFNRPGDTWLPPPPGYPVQEALQTMTMSYVQNVPNQCDRITWRGAYYHLKEGAEAARQPAPVAVKRWEDRANEAIASGASIDHFNGFRDAEIAELRAALAATAAPVLSDERIDWLANCACPGGIAYPSQVKAAIRDALHEASTNRSQP